MSKHCLFSGFAYGKHPYCLLKWQVAHHLPSRSHSVYGVLQFVTEITISPSAL